MPHCPAKRSHCESNPRSPSARATWTPRPHGDVRLLEHSKSGGAVGYGCSEMFGPWCTLSETIWVRALKFGHVAHWTFASKDMFCVSACKDMQASTSSNINHIALPDHNGLTSLKRKTNTVPVCLKQWPIQPRLDRTDQTDQTDHRSRLSSSGAPPPLRRWGAHRARGSAWRWPRAATADHPASEEGATGPARVVRKWLTQRINIVKMEAEVAGAVRWRSMKLLLNGSMDPLWGFRFFACHILP